VYAGWNIVQNRKTGNIKAMLKVMQNDSNKVGKTKLNLPSIEATNRHPIRNRARTS